MDKKLPNMYINKIDKKLTNNEKIYASSNRDIEESDSKEIKIEKNINQKINDIFKSSKYIYKADVVIKLKDKEVNKKIIGKNKNSLITIDNELIPIDNILDIKFKE